MISPREQSLGALRPLYDRKDATYFSAERIDLVKLINRSGLKVLEIGCGEGDTGRALLEIGTARKLSGVEMVASRAERARTVFDDVRIGNVEEMEFDWEPGEFDCLVFGDVLEHLANPWGLLKRLRPFLADDGIAVASVPNVKHLSVVANLILRDEWRYVESGVLDQTHLRFFTRSSAVSLFSESGYSTDLVRPSFNGRRYSIPNRLTLGAFAGFLAQRWLMRFRAAADGPEEHPTK